MRVKVMYFSNERLSLLVKQTNRHSVSRTEAVVVLVIMSSAVQRVQSKGTARFSSQNPRKQVAAMPSHMWPCRRPPEVARQLSSMSSTATNGHSALWDTATAHPMPHAFFREDLSSKKQAKARFLNIYVFRQVYKVMVCFGGTRR